MSDPKPPRWLKPANKVMIALQKLGVPTGPPMVLTVPGRKTGQPRSTPMTPFTVDGQLYTAAGYPGADWERNARAAGSGPLTPGPKNRPGETAHLAPHQARPGPPPVPPGWPDA